MYIGKILNLEQIHESWSHDCVIDPVDLDAASRETPKLHAKYLQEFSSAKSKLIMLEMTQKKLLKKKWLYYNGKLSKEEIEAENWEYDPFNGLKILKGDMDYYYDADPEIQKSVMKIEYQKEIISVLKEIVETLRWRHNTIGNSIKFRIFQAGG